MCYYSAHSLTNHRAREGEVPLVGPTHLGGTAMFGDKEEVACVADKTRLQVLAVTDAPRSGAVRNGAVQQILPGEDLIFRQNSFRGDRIIVGKREFSLSAFVGFKFQLIAARAAKPPREEDRVRVAIQEEALAV